MPKSEYGTLLFARPYHILYQYTSRCSKTNFTINLFEGDDHFNLCAKVQQDFVRHVMVGVIGAKYEV